MKELVEHVVFSNVQGEALRWLQETVLHLNTPQELYTAFTQVSRKTGKGPADLSTVQHQQKNNNDFLPGGWSIDRFCRIYLLMSYPARNEEEYYKVIENLFKAADMNELVAIYSALPFLSYPELWKKRCAEGIRSNIGLVLEAIMYDNTYPSLYLDEAGWNQMVLKAFFTDKQVERITGLKERNNRQLAVTLVDYAHERWSAKRTINPKLWLLVGQFAEEAFMPDFEKVLTSGEKDEIQSLADGVELSDFLPAKKLLETYRVNPM